MMTPKEVAAVAAKALDERKGVDVTLLEITDVTTIADYFLICTGTSSTHVKSLCDAVEEAMDKAGEPALRREGHVFTEETRQFYDLERLWSDAKRVDLGEVLAQ